MSKNTPKGPERRRDITSGAGLWAESARRRRRRQVSETHRKGIKASFFHDAYFHLMKGSWTRFFAIIIFLFFLSNGVFAFLYSLDLNGISGLQFGNFWDAFFFSVQTSSTIGYGEMSPNSTYVHVLVTGQAVLTVLGTAFATGLMFAKASRPRASVLFSEVMVISEFEGQKNLMFRLGNARDNEIVEANINVAALVETVTKEGTRFRKLHDLVLERSRTPLFALTWQVFHRLTAQSPIFGLSEEELEQRVHAIVVTMTGHDSTYGQVVHARHTYYPEDIRHGHVLVDVISTEDDDRLVVDYTKFHMTRPSGSST
jgi:inward rectifier potassium channel